MTAADIAAGLGAEINSAFIAAMQGGFVANCSRGGTVRIQSLIAAPGGGRVTLTNTPVTFSGCAHAWNGRAVAAHGTLTGSGTWTATEPTSPVRLTGDLTVDDVGVISIDGSTGASFVGSIGGVGIGVGNPDTPPPPNPTPAPCTVEGVPVPCPEPGPAPTPTPAPPPAPVGAINVTGTWFSGGQAVMTLVQTGAGIAGTVLAIPPLPAGTSVTANSITGSISGSAVSLTWTLGLRSTGAGITITQTGETRYVLQATDSSTMSGTFVTTVRTVASGCGDLPCPPPTTTTTSGSTGTMTKQ